MFEAAQITAPISLTGLPQRAMACSAALTAISARIDSSSFERSGITGRIRSGSMMPSLFITKRDLMPEAFSMNSGEEGARAITSPAAMASALAALNRSTKVLKASTSSALEMLWGGVNSPVAAMTACGKTTVPMMRAGRLEPTF